MEILITSIALATILLLAVIIGTGGRPMVFVTSVGEVLSTLAENKIPLFWTALCVLLILGFLYFFYVPPATSIGP